MKGSDRTQKIGVNERWPALRSRSLRAILLVGLFTVLACAHPRPVLAIGPNAVMYPTGWNTNAVARGDDTSNLVVNLPFTMDWMGSNYSQLYLNMNGNVTFTSGFTSYTPGVLTGVGQGIMAPFWADVDTRYVGNPNQLYYSNITSGSVPTVNGHNAFLVTWSNVMRYNGSTQSSDTTNTFQLVIVDRSDTGAGNFDFMFNYDKIVWDMGTASTTHARAGWATATGQSYELPGSGTAGALLDSGPSGTSLVQNSLDSGGQLGRYVWQVRSGAPPNSPPVITVANHVLEANSSNGYNGYTAAGDATATDVDGYVWTLTNNCPANLPFGTTPVTWMATDNWGATTTATESITVTDTTAPTNPTLISPTHTAGVWSNNPTVTINGANATDIGSGLRGFSYSWSPNAPSTPDATIDAISTSTASATTTSTVTRVDPVPVDVDYFPSSTWPAGWTQSDTTYSRLTNATGRFHDTYAAEIWANSTTRRTVNFYEDYNLSGLASATVSFWDNVSALTGGTDYARVEYSTNGGTTWTQLQNLTAVSAWNQYTFNLPVGGTVRVRFSASVNATTEYADWDDIMVTGYRSTTSTVSNTSILTSLGTTSTPGQGPWYFNVRTVDAAGNWSAASSFGPVDIDTVKPTTTSNAPSAWATATVNVSLVATDPSGPVAYTKYKLDAAAVTTYTAAVAVSGDGTHTLLFWSADMAGNVEATKSATIQIDTTAPSLPTSVGASAVSTTSVEVSWAASTDSISGVLYYAVYRNGSLVGTTTATTYTDMGLTGGSTYGYYVVAVNGAGLRSGNSVTVNATVPSAELWISLSTDTVNMGTVSPGLASTLTSATTVKVGGVGNLTYDFWCSALDFSNSTTSSVTPTMPINALSYSTSGWVTVGLQPFTNAPNKLDTSSGTKYVWEHDYRFDYVANVPWAYDPGTYTTNVTYTVVER